MLSFFCLVFYHVHYQTNKPKMLKKKKNKTRREKMRHSERLGANTKWPLHDNFFSFDILCTFFWLLMLLYCSIVPIHHDKRGKRVIAIAV